MTQKLSISVTDEHARLISEAVESGDYASTSEIVREALRDWRARREIRRLWDEGLASGLPEDWSPDEMEAIKSEARALRERKLTHEADPAAS